jgi:hypothetical protein
MGFKTALTSGSALSAGSPFSTAEDNYLSRDLWSYPLLADGISPLVQPAATGLRGTLSSDGVQRSRDKQ